MGRLGLTGRHMADAWIVLKRIEEMEGSLAGFYEWLGDRFSGMEEIHVFFNHLSREEAGHRDLVSYQARIVRSNPKLFPPVDVDLSLIQRIENSIQEFRTRSVPTLEGALTFSLSVENSLAEHYFNTVMSHSNPEVAVLIEKLSAGCKKHHRDLARQAEKHGIPPRDAGSLPEVDKTEESA